MFSSLAIALCLAAEPTLHVVQVPSALSAVTSTPELSGLVWSAALERYLVVSDDTGLAERGTYHAPMVLGMDAAGKLDEKPIPITGIRSLNDPEAICEGPDGTYFLATSASPNRKGRTHANRRQLLHLEVSGRSLAVLGRIDLTAVEGGRSLLQIARLSPDGLLDIEAIAYRDGALFIGLKSPLTAEGRAVVLRLADPVKATRDGRVEEKALSTWAELPLCLRVKGKRVCQGLSDMLFLDDGSLVVSANAPKGGKKDHGGAIWLAPPPIGKAPPRLLRTFPGLKPEGVAFSPQRHTLLVVFDRGQEKEPLWTEIPVPADSASEAGSTPGARP